MRALADHIRRFARAANVLIAGETGTAKNAVGFELPVDAQGKLLRIVEEKRVERLLHAQRNEPEAARILGISRKALMEKRQRFGLE